ncbi:MAG: BrnT family toxin [bacterium]
MDVVYSIQGVEFEWNTDKAALNLKMHQVPFSEAATVFIDPLSITVFDPNHSIDREAYEQGDFL